MLENQQIDYLFSYCSENGVKYYDVQTELVDHLANGIEELQKENPGLGFEAALNKVHLSFGYDGFEKMAKEKEREARRNNGKLLWASFKRQFQWPKIILSAVLFLGFYSIAGLADKNLVERLFKAIPISIGFYIIIAWFRIYRIQLKSKIMFTLIQETSQATFYIYIINFLEYWSPTNNLLKFENKMVAIGLSLAFALYSILGIAIINTITQIKKRIIKDYSSVLKIAR